MWIVFVLIEIIFLIPLTVFAGFEKSVGFAARSYPVATSFVGEFSYKSYFWGDDKTLLNGYFKPITRLTTIGLAHSAKVEIEIAPINLLVFSGGGSVLQNNSNLIGINCDQINCQGFWSRSFWAVEAMFGISDFAVTSKYTQTQVNYSSASSLWIDPATNLVFRSASGEVKSLESRFVMRNIKQWIYGIISDVGWKGDQTGVAQDAQYIFARYNPEPYSYILGLGRYNAGEYQSGFSAFTYIRYYFN